MTPNDTDANCQQIQSQTSCHPSMDVDYVVHPNTVLYWKKQSSTQKVI